MFSFSCKALLGAVALTAVCLFATAPAQAVTFAQFTQLNTSDTPLIFNRATNSLTATNSLVRFSFGVNQINAVFNYSATVGPNGAGVNNTFAASLTNVNFSFVSVVGGVNLLTATSSTGQLVATGASGGMNGSDTNASATDDVVNYTSSIFDFSLTTERSFGFGLSDITPIVSTANPQSFVASGSGTFSSEPAPITIVPEANAGLLAGLALPLLGGVAILRRKK